jgi:YfiH family protein
MMPIPDPQPSGAFAWTQEPWGRGLRCTQLDVPHLFTSRDVMLREEQSEWTAVARSLGVTPERLLLIRQVHGRAVAVARRGETDGWQRPEADAIVTDDPAVAIGVRTADCAPVLIADRARRVAAAAHAGWRGTAIDIVGATVETLRREFGCRPGDLTAAVGPCLGACCGEVGPDVLDAFRAGGATDDQMAMWFSAGRGDRSFLDLERANRDRLVRAGVAPSRIFTSGLCTKTHRDRLHSYRGDGAAAGRLLAAIRAR